MAHRFSNRYSRRDFTKLLATASLIPVNREAAAEAQSDRPFVMDVHIHMAEPGDRPRSEVLAELYRPWKHVYGAKGLPTAIVKLFISSYISSF